MSDGITPRLGTHVTVVNSIRVSVAMYLRLLTCLLAVGFAGIASSEPIAFPGAIGFGAGATGWRGGEVIAVTTLEDRGEGSLRACVELDVPRVCVFQVSGTIELDSELRVGSNVYVAGQTAPGDGIQLKLRDSIRSPLVIKGAHDVVIRFLKVRPGPSIEDSPAVDGITIENAERIYIDHVSVMFATDENINVHVSSSTAADITIANSIFAYGLDKATHPKGAHSKGALICSHEGSDNACGRITLTRNLFAHNRDRNPDLKATDIGPIEVINNVFYNAGSQFGEFYNNLGTTRVNYVGNVVLAGPSTRKDRRFAVEAFLMDPQNLIEIFAKDNIAMDCKTAIPFEVLDPVAKDHQVATPADPIASPVFSVSETMTYVLDRAGDQIPGTREADDLDARVLNHVRNCDGRIVDDPLADLGGWPEISADREPAGSDGSGLDDARDGLRPSFDLYDPQDAWAKLPGAETSNLEHYLARLAGDA